MLEYQHGRTKQRGQQTARHGRDHLLGSCDVDDIVIGGGRDFRAAAAGSLGVDHVGEGELVVGVGMVVVVAIEATGAMHVATHGIWLLEGWVDEDEAAQKMDYSERKPRLIAVEESTGRSGWRRWSMTMTNGGGVVPRVARVTNHGERARAPMDKFRFDRRSLRSLQVSALSQSTEAGRSRAIGRSATIVFLWAGKRNKT